MALDGPRSKSQLRMYTTCPRKWALYRIHRWRPRLKRHFLEFGTAIDAGACRLIATGAGAVQGFMAAWEAVREAPILYPQRESWETLAEKGRALMELFEREFWGKRVGPAVTHNGGPAVQIAIHHTVGTVPFYSILDAVCPIDEGVISVVDFKALASDMDPLQVEETDELAFYQLAAQAAGLDVKALAYIVFIKTKQPAIRIHVSPLRSQEQIAELVAKTEAINQAMLAEHTYKEPTACFSMGACEFVPLCYESQKARIDQELYRCLCESVPCVCEPLAQRRVNHEEV